MRWIILNVSSNSVEESDHAQFQRISCLKREAWIQGIDQSRSTTMMCANTEMNCGSLCQDRK